MDLTERKRRLRLAKIFAACVATTLLVAGVTIAVGYLGFLAEQPSGIEPTSTSPPKSSSIPAEEEEENVKCCTVLFAPKGRNVTETETEGVVWARSREWLRTNGHDIQKMYYREYLSTKTPGAGYYLIVTKYGVGALLEKSIPRHRRLEQSVSRGLRTELRNRNIQVSLVECCLI
jgi:hypothetical protein